MKLKNSTEPLRTIGVAVTVVIAAVGVGLASIVGVVDWPWLGPTSVAIAAAVGVIGHWLGVEIGRPAVWSDRHVTDLLAALDDTDPDPLDDP